MIDFGYNVQRVENPTAFEAHYKHAKLGGSLFYAGQVDFSMLNRLYEDNPKTLITIRNWPDTDQHLRMTPDQWIHNYFAQSFGGRFIIGASNECEWTPAFLAWTLELCQKVVALQGTMRICIINLNSGHNTPNEWMQAKEILKLACDNPDIIYIGLHEYAGGIITSGFVGGNPNGTVYENGTFKKHPALTDLTNPSNWPEYDQLQETTRWHMGRFKFLEDYCKQQFGKVPSVILSEFGFDYLGDIAPWLDTLPRDTLHVDGWQTLMKYWKTIWPNLSTADAMKLQYAYIDENIYQGSCVKVKYIYTYGPNPDWTRWRVDGYLESWLEEFSMANFVIKDENKIYKFVVPGGSNLNIRSQAAAAGTVLGKLPSGSIAVVLSRYLQNNNNWCRINFNGLEGFVSLLTNTSNVDTVSLSEIIPPIVINPPVVTPPPIVTPPPVETNWTAVKSDLAAAIATTDVLKAKLQSIQTLLPS